MYDRILILSCIGDDIDNLIRVNLFLCFDFFLVLVILGSFMMVFFVIIFFILVVIIVIHSCNPICIVEDNSMSLLKIAMVLKALMTTSAIVGILWEVYHCYSPYMHILLADYVPDADR